MIATGDTLTAGAGVEGEAGAGDPPQAVIAAAIVARLSARPIAITLRDASTRVRVPSPEHLS